MEIDMELVKLSLKEKSENAGDCQICGVKLHCFRNNAEVGYEDMKNNKCKDCLWFVTDDKIHRSVTVKDLKMEAGICSSCIINIYAQDKEGDTDLHIGIIQRMTSLVLMFISAAPNSECLNIVNLHLQTPLHLAVITKQVDIVRRLMTSGAQIDICDIHGNTPLHIACREGYVDIVRCLLQPVYFEETHVDKHDIHYQIIRQVLNRRNRDGRTCLHLASLSIHLKVLELLVSRGADVNSGDGTSGRTVLHYAAETGNRILLHFLVSKKKINISCRTYGGLTPLILAAGSGYSDIVTILLDHGAEVSDTD